MRTNQPYKSPAPRTHEGAVASRVSALESLQRSVMSCLLWEKEFYEEGEDIAARIVRLVGECDPEIVGNLAVLARQDGKLRHAPLLMTAALARTEKGRSMARIIIPQVVQRADELSELLAIHAKLNGVPLSAVRKKIPHAMKRGLAEAFSNFDEYQLAKYDRDGAIRLRDVLRLVHPKPSSPEQADLWKRLNSGELATPDTWEVALSSGADKKETFERLISERKLGYLALLRNLRNMVNADCNPVLIEAAILARRGAYNVLPYRFVAALRAAPRFATALDQALRDQVNERSPHMEGTTIIMVDVSASMDRKLSAKSDLTRLDAASTLASVIPGDRRVFTFSDNLVEVPAWLGMAGIDAINKSQQHRSTMLHRSLLEMAKVTGKRLIIITDEQSSDGITDVPPNIERGYIINVASAQNGVGYGKWHHINGFSENVLRYIVETEKARLGGALWSYE